LALKEAIFGAILKYVNTTEQSVYKQNIMKKISDHMNQWKKADAFIAKKYLNFFVRIYAFQTG
jgi:hypothetical protein